MLILNQNRSLKFFRYDKNVNLIREFKNLFSHSHKHPFKSAKCVNIECN